jgi:hypothetical protein
MKPAALLNALSMVGDVARLTERLGGSIRTIRITENVSEAEQVIGFIRELLKDIEATLEIAK